MGSAYCSQRPRPRCQSSRDVLPIFTRRATLFSGGSAGRKSSLLCMARPLRFVDNESGVVEITARTLHGRFLLRPSPEVNDIILGALGRAQARYGVELYAFVFMSNHFHLLMRVDSAQQMAAFVGYVMSKIAKELGRMHGWREKFWGRRYHSASLEDAAEVQQERLLYLIRNGCKEGLVDSPLQWPGVSSVQPLCDGRNEMVGLWFDRTAEYDARRRGEPRPEPHREVVRLTPLPFMAEWRPEQRRRFVVNAIRDIALESRRRHRISGTRSVGARRIRRQRPKARPSSFRPSPAPMFHTSSPRAYWRMRDAREAKVAAYRRAAILVREGRADVRFPPECFPPAPAFVRARAAPA